MERIPFLLVLLPLVAVHAGASGLDGAYPVTLGSSGYGGAFGAIHASGDVWMFALELSSCSEWGGDGHACQIGPTTCSLRTSGLTGEGDCEPAAVAGWAQGCDRAGCYLDVPHCAAPTCAVRWSMRLTIVHDEIHPHGLRELRFEGEADWFPDGKLRRIEGRAGGLP